MRPSPSHLLNPLAGKWTLPVIAVLQDGPCRFNALRRALPGITAKSLTEVLRRMEAYGLVQVSPDDGYLCTPLGQSLAPHVLALLAWAEANALVLHPRRIRLR